MCNEMFNLAIVGLGGMGNWHRELIEGIDNLTVCGTYDIKEDRQAFAREHGINPYNSFKELLEDEKVDIVLCATPNDVHKEIVISSLKAGKNVICEKPAAMSSLEFKKMVDIAEEMDKVLVVHQNRRWDEDFLTVKKIYDEAILGNVFRIESRVHGSRGIPGDWRQEEEHGGGMLLDWGVHIIDQACMMINERIKSIYARFTHVTNELVDDGFTAELEFESGLIYVVEVGTSNFINLPRWYVLGQNGTAVIDDWNLRGKVVRITDSSKNDAIPIRTAAGLTKTMAPRTEETIKEEALKIVNSDVKDFYRNVMGAIRGEEEILVKNTEVMRVIKLMESIRESVIKKKVIEL
ncbi:oxidoreductase [Clostridium beijerinckii]|uniref:Gfo/Idh/MocA family oxidoreductase n=1 Tax=Clostridium beijerinckii TaxID=1520 RepID=A0AB74VFJ4_CLOBE|nr:Gfo/Idh/MocA family oxidoreductase [Clostridium beijerinckii]NRZ29368.1 putative dehydrogenase [Clostridium beijerinckii]NYB94862.1 putative dehydrogenase [Clostridium beijerinckii]OOM28098.1 scyllo-inositol 2-dehydrogenase [Clostridium beijerinckii]QUN35004.1 Gfo/Idh/MocA family oxidoreductase [Clostridium beijerinckii]SQB00010.1 oxidoreductase domain-containing protein [Clostridium beijerinckii]